MKKLIKVISLISLSVVAYSEESLIPLLEDAKISVPTPRIKIPLGDVVFIGVKGKIKVFPSSELNGYIRSEEVDLNLSLQESLGIDFFASADLGATGEFVRLYESQAEALKPRIVFKPSDVPHTAKKALRLKKGDYYRAQMKAALGIGPLLSDSSISGLKLRAGAQLFVYSDFQFEVYKKEGARVFVRASSLSEEGLRVFAKVKSDFGSELFDLGVIDKILPSLVNFNVLTQTEGKFFSVEYDYNLDDERARSAYNQFLNFQDWELEDLKVLGPFSKGTKEAAKIMLAKVEPSEDLSNKTASSENYAVRKGVQSDIDFVKTSTYLSVNLVFAKFRSGIRYLDQTFSVMADYTKEEYEHYRISSIEINEKWSIFLKTFFEDIKRKASIIFSSDNKGKIKKFNQINFSYERLESSMSRYEGSSMEARLNKLFPEEIASEIFDEVFQSPRKSVSFLDQGTVKFKYAASLDGAILNELSKLRPKELERIVDSFFIEMSSKIKKYDVKFEDIKRRPTGEDATAHKDLYNFLRPEINDLIDVLIQTFITVPKGWSNEQRWSSLRALQQNHFFQIFGAGVLMRLSHAAAKKEGKSLKDYIYFAIKAKTRAIPEVLVEYGDFSEKNKFLDLLDLKDSVLNRRYDSKYSVSK